MSYTVQQIKVFAYNRTEKPDFTVAERDLFLCLAYVYEWYRANPDDKEACEQLAKKYIEHFETDYQNSQVMNSVPLNRQNDHGMNSKTLNSQNEQDADSISVDRYTEQDIHAEQAELTDGSVNSDSVNSVEGK